MPANKNAFIRYKTIDNCLYGGRRRWEIRELIDACSDALSYSHGHRTSVSERTVRDDIRVMRGEILGFNAPIEQTGGLYFYSDPDYSIMRLSLTDSSLIAQVISLLQSLRTQVNHPQLEIMLDRLKGMNVKKSYGKAYGDDLFSEMPAARIEPEKKAPKKETSKIIVKQEDKIIIEHNYINSDIVTKKHLMFALKEIEPPTWGDILKLLS